jgi:branched-chain amino acid transport system substrate-binding protein
MGVRRRVLLAAALASVLALAVVAAVPAGAGEGDFDDLEKIKPPSPCEDDPGVSDTEIKVGAILPTSGPQAQSFSSARDGIEARFAKANEEGELGKRTLALEVADDAADTARNLTAAQQLVEQDGVFGVIEVSSAAAGSAGYLNAQEVPVAGWHVGIAAWGENVNMFGWRNSQPPEPADTFTTRQADFLKELGATKVAIVATNVQASATFADQIEEAVDRTKGLEAVYKTTDLTPADREFTGVVEEIRESGADAVYTGMDFLQNTALNAALTQAGVEPKAVVFPGGYDSRTTGLEGMEGVYFGIEFVPFELDPPAFAEYQARMEQADKHFYGQVPYIGWLSADAFIRGLKAAGVKCPTREAFINNLRLVKGYDADGAFIPVDFAEIFGRPFYCVYYVQVVNQAFVPQFDGEPFCASRLIDDGKVKKIKPSQAAKG